MASCSSVKYFLQAIKQKKQCADGNFFEKKRLVGNECKLIKIQHRTSGYFFSL